MPRPDRLLVRSTYRLALRHASRTSPEAIKVATPDELARLRDHRAAILALVRAGNPDVLRALFCPPEPIDRQCATLGQAGPERLLVVTRGAVGWVGELLVTLTYRADDREDERRAWRALKEALREG